MTYALRFDTGGTAGEQQIVQQLQAAEARLVEQYAGHSEITEDQVRGTFGQVTRRFVDARVRTFLPILVERAVRRELGRRG